MNAADHRVSGRPLPDSGPPDPDPTPGARRRRRAYLRPVIDVGVGGHDLRLGCLVDTGALHNRFGRWVADVLGVDLDAGERARIALGGVIADAVTVPVPMALGDWGWSAPVSFCEPWPFDFQILGQDGFLRFFRVLLVA